MRAAASESLRVQANAPKVIFVNRYFHPDTSATSQLLTDLASALVGAGFDVHVICSRQRYDDPSERLNPRQSVNGVEVQRVWTTRFGRRVLMARAIDYFTFYCSSTWVMIGLLKRGDILVAKTDPPLISIAAMLAAQLKGAHLINWLQDIFPEIASLLGANPLPRVVDGLMRRCRNRSLRLARINIVIGERMRDRVQAQGIASDRICVIENWAERHPENPKPVAHSILRSKLDLEDKFVVGYSGNLGRAHEFQTVLEAAELLRADRQTVFLMVGGGVGMTQLALQAAARKLENFRFIPYQPRECVSDSLAAADVHWVSLLPALEGLIVPSKFYGILAAGRPVVFIGDADGELARQIEKSSCGVSVNVGEAGELARHLRDWRLDPARRSRMGEAGYRYYREHYAAERALDQWVRILKLDPRAPGVWPQSLSGQ